MCGTTTASQTVTINLPTISGNTNIATSSTGNVYTVSVAGATYAWSFVSNSNGATIIGSTTGQSVTITAGAGAGSFNLQCIVTFGGCSYNVTIGVTVNPCSGVLSKDPNAGSAQAGAQGGNTLTIVTSNNNDMIVINVGGYGSNTNNATVTYTGPSSGTATQTYSVYNALAASEVYWFPAALAGTYHITVTEPASYVAGYYQNQAVAITGFCAVPTAADILAKSNISYTSCADPTTITAPNIATVAGSIVIGTINNYWYASGSGPETYTGTAGAWTTYGEGNAAGGGVTSSIGGSPQAAATGAYSTVGHDAGGWCYGVLCVLDKRVKIKKH